MRIGDHEHTTTETRGLANAYIDLVEKKRSQEQTVIHLATEVYLHEPSPGCVRTYVGAAKNAYQEIQARTDVNDVKWRYSNLLREIMVDVMIRRGHFKAKAPTVRRRKPERT